MDAMRLLPVLKHWWRLIAVAVVIAVALAFTVLSDAEATYEAEARLLVGPVNTDADTIDAAGLLGETYAELATSDLVLGALIEGQDLDTSVARLRAKITATADEITRVVTVRVRDDDPRFAASLAGAVSDSVIALAARGTQRPEGELQTIDAARIPTEPIRPQRFLMVGLAGAAAAFAAGAAALGLDRLTRPIKGEEDVQVLEGVEVLGTARELHAGGLRARLSLRRPHHVRSDYRLIAGRVSAELPRDQRSVLILTAVDHDDDARQATAELALALREGGRSVTVADAAEFEALDLAGDAGQLRSRASRPQASDLPARPGAEAVDRGHGVPRNLQPPSPPGSHPVDSGDWVARPRARVLERRTEDGGTTPPSPSRQTSDAEVTGSAESAGSGGLAEDGRPVGPQWADRNGGGHRREGDEGLLANEVYLVRIPSPRHESVPVRLAEAADVAVVAVPIGRSRIQHLDQTVSLLRLLGLTSVRALLVAR